MLALSKLILQIVGCPFYTKSTSRCSPRLEKQSLICFFVAMNISSKPSTQAITLQVNGETRICKSGTLLPDLLAQIGLNPKLIVVGYNGDILPRTLWATTQLKNNDHLEIVISIGDN